ncbi:hypothetical protein EDD66_11032 [Mobilisporobacter senegalensis]|uniref:Uncharacterized protein n=1 Tax=Mobilisporobacter senegalensis TaxID=1329262 RepID=A0A3N1XG42_9FIRM|nr:hypothetical protein [Mobilisporobacter senegalensis]ROR25676.1 hypothetical protein EDD66_11032 [Mobilisporobacter senegalensis]
MKKVLALLLCSTLVVSMFTACGKTKEAEKEEVKQEETTEVAEETTEEVAETTEGAAKTGLAVITSIGKSKDAAEEDGLAQADSVVVAVLVGEDGKILDCALDTAQTKINFSKEGKITTDLATVFKAKQDLGDEYGMKKASSIGKEWFEQANALTAYAVGKTVDELKGIAVNEEGVPTDADLASSVTVHITDYVAAIEKAVANAKDLGAKAGDKLGLGVSTTIAKSTDAAEEDGLAQAYSSYVAITQGADGKITSCAIDASQSNINFSKEGKVTTDLAAAELKTKQELGEAYGMKKASGIGKEWFEQADAFAQYVTGKTVDEVKGIALTEGAPADADLASSVTVHVTDYMSLIELAAAHIAK